MRRPDIGNRALIGLVAGIVLVLLLYFSLLPLLPQALRTPGSPVLYVFGATGACLLLVSMVFVLVKRTGRGGPPPAWFVAHVGASSLGTVLVAIYSAGYLRRPPALLFLARRGSSCSGSGRGSGLSRRIAGTFGIEARAFRGARPGRPRTAARPARAQGGAAADARSQSGGRHLLPDAGPLAQAAPRLRPLRAAGPGRKRADRHARAAAPQQAWWRAAHLALAYTFSGSRSTSSR